MAPLLEIENIRLDFDTAIGSVRVLDGVSLRVDSGATVCLVGESGSGKSVTALSIAGLLPSPPARLSGGNIRLDGRDLLRLPAAALREIRGRIVSYVFQEPATSLNPVLRIGKQIREVLEVHRPESATHSEVVRLLERVGIPAAAARCRDYPHELSGGMQQRVMIAMALAAHPRLLIADEPTTALDVTIQAQILDLLRDLQRELQMAILLITHNLGLVSELADRVAVMYAGEIVEESPARELLRQPLHPYTRGLLRSVPVLGSTATRLSAIPGSVPRPGAWPGGCRFHPRCPIARPSCSESRPVLTPVGGERSVRCPYWHDTSISP